MASGLPPAGNPDFLDALLHGMGPDHLQQLDELLGLSAPQPDQTQEQMPQQGLGSQVLGSFAGLENQPAPNPQDFGTSFAAGLSRGLGSAGSRVQAQRAKLESDIQSRARARAAANLQATHDYQQAQQAGRRGIVMAGLQGQIAAQAAADKKLTPKEIKANAQAQAEGTAAGKPPDESTLQTGDLTPAGLDAAAKVYAATGQLPPMGMGKSPLRAKIINRAAELMPTLNPAANKVQMQAEGQNLVQLTRQQGQTRQQERTASRNADLMLSLAGKIPDTGIPILNALVRPGAEKLFGSRDVSNFNTALATVQPEFARILTQGPSGGGPLSDSARHELQAMISGHFTKSQLVGAIKTLKRDAANRVRSQQEEIDSAQKRISLIGSGQQRPPIESFETP